MQKRNVVPLKVTVALALLSAISIVAGKYLAIRGGDILRFSFENLPIIFAGVGFGPLGGAIVGVLADLIGCVLVGYAINPLVTVGAAAIGLISGLVWMLLRKVSSLPLSVRVGITVAAAHIIGSVLIKTYGLAKFYDMHLGILMLWRLLNYLIVGAFEGALIYLLLKNRMVTAQLDSLNGGKR